MNKLSTMMKCFLLLYLCSIYQSCVFDTVSTYYIKNCTNDTLLMTFSKFSTFSQASYLPKEDFQEFVPKDIHNGDFVLFSAMMADVVFPDTCMSVDANLYSNNATCYIYTMKWDQVKNMTLAEIEKRKLYKKRSVLKSEFKERYLEYR